MDHLSSAGMPEGLERGVDRILAFARRDLGPACERALRDPVLQALLQHRLRAGAPLARTVLAALSPRAAAHPAVGAELLAFFLRDLDARPPANPRTAAPPGRE